MKTQILLPNQREPGREIERSEKAAIAAEIARRLLDMREASSGTYTKSFIAKLHVLSNANERETLWFALSLLTGDLSELTRSYKDVAKQHALDKQAVQQQLERVIADIRRYYPEFAKAVVQLRHMTADIGEAHTLNGHGEKTEL